MTLDAAVAIFVVSFFFSMGVQSLFYFYYKLTRNPLIEKQQHVFQYVSGYVGDGILIPLANVVGVATIWYVDVESAPWLIIASLLGGAAITFFLHYNQARHNLCNWTMPQKNKWTTLGVYHAIFQFFESSFLCYVLLVQLVAVAQDGTAALAWSPIWYGVALMVLFWLTFVYDYWKPLFRRLIKNP